MYQFFVKPEQISDRDITITGSDVNHIKNVLRMKPGERVRIRSYIEQLSKDRIILYATHVVSDIESIADQIVLLKKGQVVGMGSVPKLIAQAGDKETGQTFSLEDVFQRFCEE